MLQAKQSPLNLSPSSTSKAHAPLINIVTASTFTPGSRRAVSVIRRRQAGRPKRRILATLRESQTEVASRVDIEGKPLLDRAKDVEEKVEWKGTIVLERLNFLDLNNYLADVKDRLSEVLGARVNVQLVSMEVDPETGEGKRSEKACLENWVLKPGTWTADTGTEYSVRFKVDGNFGRPGAILFENEHSNAFLLRNIKLEREGNDDGYPTVLEFACDSWVYDPKKSGGPRIFFINQTFLPGQTPAGLQGLRRLELQNLRGTGSGERVSSDRIYDYDVYNDLGVPDKGEKYIRPVLGGNTELPYPRRCRTGRQRSTSDPVSENPVSKTDGLYVPADEVFDRAKNSDFLGSSLKSVLHVIAPAFRMLLKFSLDFKSFKEVRDLYSKVVPVKPEKIPRHPLDEETGSLEMLREITDPRGGDTNVFRFPYPQIIQVKKDVWSLDDEFARQMIAGVNPIVIERLKVFPPVSTLDPKIYGNAISSIRAEHIEPNLEGMTVDEAIRANKIYTVDYHDAYLPFVERINKLEGKAYASRTLLFLTKKGTLKPVAIELSLPPSANGTVSKINRVFVPPEAGKTDHIWNLAKTHATLDDVGYHQVVSHWVRTHACMEPFIIATHRQLSIMHPVYRLLLPHFKDTMYINSLARKSLINAFSGSILDGGIIEYAFTPGRYAMEMGAAVYKSWRLDEQALPADLIKRGMAERDTNAEHGVRLLMKDYPYAVDGLEIWGAIKGWATDYANVYYQNDEEVAGDEELQAWWKEIREVGHGDKAAETWWVDLNSREALAEVATTIMWVASGHHAAVNFGQFSYGGFPPSRPTMGRRLIPIEGSKEYSELTKNPEEFFLKTMSSEVQSLLILATLEILSMHAIEEQYLGHHTPGFGTEPLTPALKDAMARFRERIQAADQACQKRNADPRLINRRGEGFIPYTLLLSFSPEPGLSGRGIPNSISI